MIQSEVSIYPLGTKDVSVSFYNAKAIETIQNMKDIKYQINAMGTTLESKSMDAILKASKEMTGAVHNLGIKRLEVIIKIDSRKDKDYTICKIKLMQYDAT